MTITAAQLREQLATAPADAVIILKTADGWQPCTGFEVSEVEYSAGPGSPVQGTQWEVTLS